MFCLQKEEYSNRTCWNLSLLKLAWPQPLKRFICSYIAAVEKLKKIIHSTKKVERDKFDLLEKMKARKPHCVWVSCLQERPCFLRICASGSFKIVSSDPNSISHFFTVRATLPIKLSVSHFFNRPQAVELIRRACSFCGYRGSPSPTWSATTKTHPSWSKPYRCRR